jgi:RNA-binding protein
MLNSKQRSYLRKLANPMDCQLHLGKADVSDTQIQSLEDLLSVRELIKASVLKSAAMSVADIAGQMADAVGGEVVQVIGRRFVIYRHSDKLAKEDRSIVLPRESRAKRNI